MRHTQVVIDQTKSWMDKGSVKYTADGKLDVNELSRMYANLLNTQCALALAIRDVYDAVSRIEQDVKRLKGRGPLGG